MLRERFARFQLFGAATADAMLPRSFANPSRPIYLVRACLRYYVGFFDGFDELRSQGIPVLNKQHL